MNRKKMIIWHIYSCEGGIPRGRALAKPTNFWQRMILTWKGWTPFNEHWWSKPSKNLKRLIREQKIYIRITR